jgi:hypothetical protein
LIIINASVCQPNIEIFNKASGLYAGPITYHSWLQLDDFGTIAKDDDMRHLFLLKFVCFIFFYRLAWQLLMKFQILMWQRVAAQAKV